MSKASSWTQQTSFEQTDLIQIIRNSTNFTVPFSAYSAALGVTGSIASLGGGTSLLYQPTATSNFIRSIESGNGILAALSASNGVSIKHNFTFDSTGESLVINPDVASPVIKSLVGIKGVSITTVGNTLELAGDASALGVEVITEEADFPAASGGVITLLANTTYVMSASVTTVNRFTLADNVLITSNNPLANVLTSTASGGSMFTGVDTNVIFDDILLNCPNSECFNISFSANPAIRFFMLDSVIVSCTKIGTFDDLLLIDIFNCSMPIAADGVTISGNTNWDTLLIDKVGIASTSGSFTGLDLGTAVFTTLRAESITMTGPVGAISITGLASSGNMVVNSLGTLTNNSIFGGIASDGTILPSDIRWGFRGNNFTMDSIDDALLAFNGNATETVIGAGSGDDGNPIILTATWVLEDVSRFTSTTGGRATYIGERTIHLPVDVAIGLVAAGGGTKDVTVYIALNGSVVANTGRTIQTSGSTPRTISIPWQLDLSKDDYLEVFVENNTDTINIIAESCTLRVN